MFPLSHLAIANKRTVYKLYVIVGKLRHVGSHTEYKMICIHDKLTVYRRIIAKYSPATRYSCYM